LTNHRRESLFFVGCKHASGQSDDTNVTQQIWNHFDGLNVFRRGSTQVMRYWHQLPSEVVNGKTRVLAVCRTLAYLFEHDSGTCEAWANFFGHTLLVQGIEPQLYGVTLKPYEDPTHGDLEMDWLMIKEWTERTDNGVRIVEAGQTAAAQGVQNNSPHSHDSHAVVILGNTIYDPSYGLVLTTTAGAAAAYEAMAFWGYTYHTVGGASITAKDRAGVTDTNWEPKPW